MSSIHKYLSRLTADAEASYTPGSDAVAAMKRGDAYIVSTGKIDLSVAGNLRLTIDNPSASGRKVVITAITVVHTATSVAWAQVFLGPTAGLPVGAKTPQNAIFHPLDSNNNSVLVANVDTSATTALSGGVQKMEMALPANVRNVIAQGPIIVLPGSVIGINEVFAGAASAILTAYFYEEDL